MCFIHSQDVKILEATRFEDYVSGGSTIPWFVYLLDNGIEVPYIVKLFTDKATFQQYPVYKEVIACEIACQLNISTPNYALANFSSDFIDSALGDKERDILKTKHNGLKFASCFQKGMMPFSIGVENNIISINDVASVFAFDCLMFNGDRVERKPNILFDDEGYMAIDHEQTIPFIDNTIDFYNKIMERFRNRNILYKYSSHLFFNYLRGLSTAKKKGLFLNFQSDLSNIDIEHIVTIITNLSNNGISCDHSFRFIEYLRFVKKEAQTFCEIILSVLS